MQRIDIESSLRKINQKFVENLTEEEREKAIQSFKIVYAEEMSKASGEVSKRKKVHQNLQTLEKQKEIDVQTIQDEINHRMANYEKTRSKNMQIKLKQHKLLQQNWHTRWQFMLKKRRFSQMENLQKANKARQETEKYFTKKQQFLFTSKSKRSRVEQADEQRPYHHKTIGKLFSKDQRSVSIDQYQISKLYKPQAFPTIQRNTLSKKGFQTLNITEDFLQPIKYNRQKFQRINKEREDEQLQRMIDKLAKIEKNRTSVQERKEKLVMEAKKIRQQRQNPDKLARNRQRSLDALNLRRRIKESKQVSLERQNKINIDESISLHREAKKLIEESQFYQRQKKYEAKFQKIKKSKMDKLIKEAIVTLKHETLYQSRDRV